MQKIFKNFSIVISFFLVVLFFALAPSIQAQTVTVGTPPPPPASTKFVIGDTVAITTNGANTRPTPAGANPVFIQGGTRGTVLDGPVVATLFDSTTNVSTSYVWWKVSFTGGITGWSAENYLTKVDANTPPPPPSGGNSNLPPLTASLLINGSHGPITVNPTQNLNFTWTTTGSPTPGGQIVCGVEPNVPIGNPGGPSGTYTLMYTGNNPYYPWDNVYVSHSFRLTCFDRGSSRKATDVVTVLPTGVTSTPTTSVSLQAIVDAPINFTNGGTPTGTWSHPGASNPLVITSTSQRLSFKWTSANADSCTLGAPISDVHSPTTSIYGNGNSWIQFSATDAVHVPAVGSTVTYTITCIGIQPDGSDGTATDSVTITNLAQQPAQGIDLIAGAPTPTTATVGSPVTFLSQITNFGTVASGPIFANQFKVATDASGAGAISLAPITINTTSYMPAQAGVFYGGPGIPVMSPAYIFTSAGTYYVQACADSSNVFAEVNETNNCSAWTPVIVAIAGSSGTGTGTGVVGLNDWTGMFQYFGVTPPALSDWVPIVPIGPNPPTESTSLLRFVQAVTPLLGNPMNLPSWGISVVERYPKAIGFIAGKFGLDQRDDQGNFPPLNAMLITVLNGVAPLKTQISASAMATLTDAINTYVPGILKLAISDDPAHAPGSVAATGTNPPPSNNPPPVCTNLSSVIAEGSTGSDVVLLQNFLKAQGFLTTGVADGKFGPITAAAVSAFQSANGIDPVGSVGPITRAKISVISCGSSVTNPGTTAITPPCPAGMVQSGNSCVVYSGTAGNNHNLSISSPTFSIGDWVTTNISNVDAHSNASSTSPVLATYPINTGGTVLDGPTVSGDSTWWEVGFAGGVTGWTVAANLTKSGVNGNTNNGGNGGSNCTNGALYDSNTGARCVTAGGTAFVKGDTVATTAILNVRSSAGNSSVSNILVEVPAGAQGTIQDGPTVTNGYTWWKIDYNTGGTSGWSVENYLTKVSGASGSNNNPAGTTVSSTSSITLKGLDPIQPWDVSNPRNSAFQVEVHGTGLTGRVNLIAYPSGVQEPGLADSYFKLHGTVNVIAPITNLSTDGTSGVASMNFGCMTGDWSAEVHSADTYAVSNSIQ